MKTQLKFPETLKEAVEYFANTDNALGFVAMVRWPDGKPVYDLSRKELFHVQQAYQFSAAE